MSRPPIPSWLKRRLLPIWNGGHRLAWRLGEFAEAVRRRRFDRCAACGRFGPMLYRRWVVPPRLEALWGLSPREAEALARKESLDCFACGAKLRARRLATTLLETFPDDGGPSKSVRAWAETAGARRLRVAEVNAIEGLHRAIAGLPRLDYSEYRQGEPPGSVHEGVRCEDLTALTYPDATFDLVLSSETLEHVPDVSAALGEIRRVLAPGGYHLCTAPVRPGLAASFPRARLRPDGLVEPLAEPLCHPGGDVGYPVFTEFGRDFPEVLRAAGFDVAVRFGPASEDDLAQVYVCRKTG